jgi:hypothetical protein
MTRPAGTKLASSTPADAEIDESPEMIDIDFLETICSAEYFAASCRSGPQKMSVSPRGLYERPTKSAAHRVPQQSIFLRAEYIFSSVKYYVD